MSEVIEANHRPVRDVSATAASTQAGPGALVIDHVGITFTARRDNKRYRAIKDVSFTVRENEFCCVVGPSGCGKSSLLLAVAGLVPASHGEMSFDGNRIVSPERDRAVVFQSASLLPWRTVIANVSYGLEMMKVPRREARERSRAIVELVGLKGFEGHYPHELSGGMQQRVNLARALVADPQLLLMDEPFAALDAQTREVMQAELLRIWGQMRKSVMFVTHQIDEAVFLGDRVIVLSKGPGTTIADIVEVNFPRPRSEEVKRTPEFLALVDRIWNCIRSGATAQN
ncbi:ABC transporter ATP-binding protein [Rugosimonospora africana]|uniref:Nitrate ABC transporter ATP-binding protein n=1 Tax=Rugosimonospora africana TaxID=556532 RepID=A0A8J3VT40_9ACTN|nr:ABC transporter ATP-binding protein [Rugosimonospora africana]GIH17800.1 nitrate ABC transporter ATP-binding protein [Rugosimonospora africana]